MNVGEPNRAARRAQAAAFTLMEVLLVLVILVILGSFAVSSITGIQASTDVQTAKTQVGLIETASRNFHFAMRRYPQNVDELYDKPSDAKEDKWTGPYLEKRIPEDPWGNAYKFASPGTHNPKRFDVWSMGPDGVDGTEDDVGNWD